MYNADKSVRTRLFELYTSAWAVNHGVNELMFREAYRPFDLRFREWRYFWRYIIHFEQSTRSVEFWKKINAQWIEDIDRFLNPFVLFLIDNEILEAYVHQADVIAFARTGEFGNEFRGGFRWRKTKEGYNFWLKIDNKYKQYDYKKTALQIKGAGEPDTIGRACLLPKM